MVNITQVNLILKLVDRGLPSLVGTGLYNIVKFVMQNIVMLGEVKLNLLLKIWQNIWKMFTIKVAFY